MNYTHITHESIPLFIDDNSTILILGSFPSVKSRELGFYYSHKSNRFFPALYKIFNEEYSLSIEDRKEFLRRHDIALYDVIEECDISSSDDSSISNAIPIDIEAILSRYPNIKRIGITGKKASVLFKRYLLDKVSIEVIYLPSTSSANAKMSIDDLVNEYRVMFDNRVPS